MTFGLRNAGKFFQRFIDEVTNGLDLCYACIDDILVFAKSEEDHKQHLRVLFEKLSDYGVTVNSKKCVLGTTEVKFLGYLVSSEGTRPPPERVDVLRQYPLPKSVQGLPRFSRMVNFYCRFILKAVDLQAPLHDIVKGLRAKGSQSVQWTPEQLKAAIMTHAKDSWTESLPIVLLGMRSSLKEDLKVTSAELVYDELLNLPSDFFVDNQENSSMNDPTSLLDRLRIVMNKIRPVPASRHSNPRSFVFADLKDCSHVFLREGGVRTIVQLTYQGPYKVLDRNDKTFTIKIRNQP
ncbi:hypothetical protein QTP88_015489 [Uroleucon formosanum]